MTAIKKNESEITFHNNKMVINYNLIDNMLGIVCKHTARSILLANYNGIDVEMYNYLATTQRNITYNEVVNHFITKFNN